MFLKLEIDSKNPVVHETEMHEIFVGSGDGSHLIINNDSVSKKHLRILFQTGQWFVIDQDSTNGSFLNGQRLVPWVKAEFNFFDTVTLGAHVSIVYMETSEDYDVLHIPEVPEGSDNLEHDKTKVISIEDIKASQLRAEQKRQKELQFQKARLAREKKIEYDRIVTTILVCVTILIIGLVSNKIYQSRKNKLRSDTIAKKIQSKNEADQEIEFEIMGFRIYRGSLLKRNFLLKLKPKPKCSQLETVPYCQKDSSLKEVLSHEKALIFFLDEKEWMQRAKIVIGQEKVDKKLLKKFAILQVLDRHFREFQDLEEKEIYLTFFSVNEKGMISVGFVGAIKGSSLTYIFNGFKEASVVGKEAAEKAVNLMNPYFTTY
jgi:pSer/pThr/pTyr-binding forkhead associated (FHA) protein